MPKKYCKHHHELTDDNVYVYRYGKYTKRNCKTCMRQRSKIQARKIKLLRLEAQGFCKREHPLNANGECPTCIGLLYHARVRRELRLSESVAQSTLLRTE